MKAYYVRMNFKQCLNVKDFGKETVGDRSTHYCSLASVLGRAVKDKAQLLLVSVFCGEDSISSIQAHAALVNSLYFY